MLPKMTEPTATASWIPSVAICRGCHFPLKPEQTALWKEADKKTHGFPWLISTQNPKSKSRLFSPEEDVLLLVIWNCREGRREKDHLTNKRDHVSKMGTSRTRMDVYAHIKAIPTQATKEKVMAGWQLTTRGTNKQQGQSALQRSKGL